MHKGSRTLFWHEWASKKGYERDIKTVQIYNRRPCFGMNGHPRRDTDVISRLSKSTIDFLSFFIGFGSLRRVKMVVLDEHMTCVCFLKMIILSLLSLLKPIKNDRKSIVDSDGLNIKSVSLLGCPFMAGQGP